MQLPHTHNNKLIWSVTVMFDSPYYLIVCIKHNRRSHIKTAHDFLCYAGPYIAPYITAQSTLWWQRKTWLRRRLWDFILCYNDITLLSVSITQMCPFIAIKKYKIEELWRIQIIDLEAMKCYATICIFRLNFEISFCKFSYRIKVHSLLHHQLEVLWTK